MDMQTLVQQVDNYINLLRKEGLLGRKTAEQIVQEAAQPLYYKHNGWLVKLVTHTKKICYQLVGPFKNVGEKRFADQNVFKKNAVPYEIPQPGDCYFITWPYEHENLVSIMVVDGDNITYTHKDVVKNCTLEEFLCYLPIPVPKVGEKYTEKVCRHHVEVAKVCLKELTVTVNNQTHPYLMKQFIDFFQKV